MEQWARLSDDREYKVLKQSTECGKMVSTIWLGLDHSFSGGSPLIFETMVFLTNRDGEVETWNEIAADRYSTEEEALKGHEEMCLSYIRPLDLLVYKLEESDKEDEGLVDSDGSGLSEAP